MTFLTKSQYQHLIYSFVSNYILDVDVLLLSASMIIFPFSVSIAVACFWFFIIRSMLKINVSSNKNTIFQILWYYKECSALVMIFNYYMYNNIHSIRNNVISHVIFSGTGFYL